MRNVIELEVYYHGGTYNVTLIMETGWWSNTWWVGGGYPGMFGHGREGTWEHRPTGRYISFFEDDDEGDIQFVGEMDYVASIPIKAGHTGDGRVYRCKYAKGTLDFHWRCREGA